MDELKIVGGFYRETCRFPWVDEFRGSGGRAAASIRELSLATQLVTAADVGGEKQLANLAHVVGFEYSSTAIRRGISFHYDHGLSTPITWPPLNEIERVRLRASGECVLQFGMLEADAEIDATTVVYDPQAPFSPRHFLGLRKPERLAYVLNATEVRQLGSNDNIETAARKVAMDSGATVVVVKCGARGALVFDGEHLATVPAYETRTVWPIGSGDVFAAVFAALWGATRHDAVRAAEKASRATAAYVETHSLPVPRAAMEGNDDMRPLTPHTKALGKDEYDVYLAGPFFNMAQLWLVDEARTALRSMGLKVFSPYHDVGPGPGHEVAPKDIAALERSQAVLALIDGGDTGTIFEAGFARAHNKPVVAFSQSTPSEPLKMISGTGCEVAADFVSAIYRVAWAAWR